MITTTTTNLTKIILFTLGIVLCTAQQQTHGLPRQALAEQRETNRQLQETNRRLLEETDLLKKIVSKGIPKSFFDWFKSRSWSGSATILAATVPLANDWKFLMKMFNTPCPAQNLCTWSNVMAKSIMTLVKTTPYVGALLGASGLAYWLFAKGYQTSKSIGKNILLSAATGLLLYGYYK